MKFSIKDFLSKYDQIRWKLRIWSHLLKKSSMENFTLLCSVNLELFSCCTIQYCTIWCSTFFVLHFYCCTIWCRIILILNNLMLHYLLHYFNVLLFFVALIFITLFHIALFQNFNFGCCTNSTFQLYVILMLQYLMLHISILCLSMLL